MFGEFDDIDIEDIQQRDHNSQKISLSRLVEEMSGKKMDKSETISNWNNELLRNEQIIYAALDAFVLIELYDWMNVGNDKKQLGHDNYDSYSDNQMIIF